MRKQEEKEVSDWFLNVYTTDAIEPLEAILLWNNENLAWSSNQPMPLELRKETYICLARIATVIDTYAFFRFCNVLLACTVALVRIQKSDPQVYAQLGGPSLRDQITRGYVEGSKFLNQLQEALRFTVINHRSDVYKLAQTDRFQTFKSRAEELSNSLDARAVGQMLTEIESRKGGGPDRSRDS